MTATAHALVGGAIASTINNPALGLTLSALSHPALDMIPHWDFGRGWRSKSKIKLFAQASFDLILGVTLAFLIFGQGVNLIYFFACIFLAEVWDMMEAPYWFLNWRFPPFSSFYNVQHKLQGRANLPFGIITQVAVVVVLVLTLKFLY